jgi:hypothetical protein
LTITKSPLQKARKDSDVWTNNLSRLDEINTWDLSMSGFGLKGTNGEVDEPEKYNTKILFQEVVQGTTCHSPIINASSKGDSQDMFGSSLLSGISSPGARICSPTRPQASPTSRAQVIGLQRSPSRSPLKIRQQEKILKVLFFILY